MVTCVPVEESYDFPRTELTAMAGNIARLIEDINRLDINRRNMMEEFKVLRDVTLFYNKQHPELRAAESDPSRRTTWETATRRTETTQAREHQPQRCRRRPRKRTAQRNNEELEKRTNIDQGDPQDNCYYINNSSMYIDV